MSQSKLLKGSILYADRDINTKPPECVVTIMRFSQVVSWKHESEGRVLSGHQLRKPSDVLLIMSTHKGSFVFIIHPTQKYLLITE